MAKHETITWFSCIMKFLWKWWEEVDGLLKCKYNFFDSIFDYIVPSWATMHDCIDKSYSSSRWTCVIIILCKNWRIRATLWCIYIVYVFSYLSGNWSSQIIFCFETYMYVKSMHARRFQKLKQRLTKIFWIIRAGTLSFYIEVSQMIEQFLPIVERGGGGDYIHL